MKVLKWSLIILGLLFLLFSSLAAPIGLIGLPLYIAGMWLFHQKQKGKTYREKPWRAFTVGMITTVVLVFIFVEEVPEEPSGKVKSVEVKKEQEQKGNGK